MGFDFVNYCIGEQTLASQGRNMPSLLHILGNELVEKYKGDFRNIFIRRREDLRHDVIQN